MNASNIYTYILLRQAFESFKKASYSYRYANNHIKHDDLPPVYFGAMYYKGVDVSIFQKVSPRMS